MNFIIFLTRFHTLKLLTFMIFIILSYNNCFECFCISITSAWCAHNGHLAFIKWRYYKFFINIKTLNFVTVTHGQVRSEITAHSEMLQYAQCNIALCLEYWDFLYELRMDLWQLQLVASVHALKYFINWWHYLLWIVLYFHETDLIS